MQTKDGLFGLAGLDEFKLHLWSRVTSTDDGVVSWTHLRVIDLERLLATEVVTEPSKDLMRLIGYAEDADVIFVGMDCSIYMIHLKSMQIEEASAKGYYRYVFPYTSFYTPGITTAAGEYQAEQSNVA
ncbi:hypothetical protein D1007_25353 [Hordeum vulgare]|nr:hypothetical protein D1007_25353 [Hordeum vulgare]